MIVAVQAADTIKTEKIIRKSGNKNKENHNSREHERKRRCPKTS